MIKIHVVLCSYVDIRLRYEDSTMQWNDRLSECLSVYTTKLE